MTKRRNIKTLLWLALLVLPGRLAWAGAIGGGPADGLRGFITKRIQT